MIEQVAQLAASVFQVLTSGEAAVEGDGAAIRYDVRADAALDHVEREAGRARARRDNGMIIDGVLQARLVVARDLYNEISHLLDSVDAAFGRAAVRLSTKNGDLAPDRTTMAQAEVIDIERLGNHHVVCRTLPDRAALDQQAHTRAATAPTLLL